MNNEMEYVRCNYCESEHSNILFKAKEIQFNIGDEFTIVKCKKCGLVYTNPRPNENLIAKYYPSGSYYTHLSVNESIKKNKSRWLIKNIVIKSLYGQPYLKENTDGNSINVKNIFLKIIALILKRYIAIIIPYKNNGNILDVGCGNGVFLHMMKQYGWNCYGIEMSEEAVNEARKIGLEVFHGRLEDTKYNSDQFDVIVANQVLEHVHNPTKFLNECNRILKKDGLLIIGVPNFNSYDSQLFKEGWTSLQVPTHLFHFSSVTLKALLNKTGFNSKFKYQPVIMQYRKGYLKKNIENLAHNGKSKNKIKYYLEFTHLLFKLFFIKPLLILTSIRKGSSFSLNITAYATKKL